MTASESATPSLTASESATPNPILRPTLSRAEMAELLRQKIDQVYRRQDPQPSWFAYYMGVAHVVRYGPKRRWAWIDTTFTGGFPQEGGTARQYRLAKRMCHDIAKLAFDDDGQPIGVTVVEVRLGGGSADGCKVLE